MSYQYDLFVIGAGSGGVRAARMAAAKGQKVAVAEDRHMGGTCVNLGCVPKKLFVYASEYQEDFHDSSSYGWTNQQKASFDWKVLLENKNKEISRLNGIYNNLLEGSDVTIYNGRAKLVDANTVDVNGEAVTAERILVAVGSKATVPTFPGNEHVITSDQMFHLTELPKRLTVVGGGYIAVEFAGIMHGLGVEVTQLYRGEMFLRGFDNDVRNHLAEEMKKKEIDLRFNTNICEVKKNDDGTLQAILEDGSSYETDCIFYATGRKPKTEKLGLEEIGVEMSRDGAILVNDDYQSSVPSVYALGDVINRVQLTPVALAEAMYFVNTTYGDGWRKVNYDLIPTAVFSQPNIGTVGLGEEEARERHGDDIEIFRSTFRSMKVSLTPRQEKTLMKLIVRKSDQRVIGLHMVGHEAGEITQGFAVAMTAGATKEHFDATIGIHPSSAEEFVTMRTPVS